MKCTTHKKNGESCNSNAMKGTKYCYIHSFWKIRGIPWYKNLTFHFAGFLGTISIGLALYFGCFGATKAKQEEIIRTAQSIPQKTADLLSENKLDPNKISLGLRYAYEFDNYLGATNSFGNEDRIIVPNVPLKKKYNLNEDVRFVFVIGNGNKSIPFDDVTLEVIFPDGIPEVLYGKGWAPQRINKRYTYYFHRINNIPLNTYSAIEVKFPNKGKYRIDCYIHGKSIDKIHSPVTIQLY